MENTDELWSEVLGYPRYSVSSHGTVFDERKKKFVEAYPHTPNGLLRVSFSSYKGRRHAYLHQVVAEAFMDGYRPGMQIIHIDGDKTNNQIDNLKPRSGRFLEGDRYEARHVRGYPVRVVETGQIFLNAYSAAAHFNTDPSTIYKVLRGERKRALGMRFEIHREEGPYGY